MSYKYKLYTIHHLLLISAKSLSGIYRSESFESTFIGKHGRREESLRQFIYRNVANTFFCSLSNIAVSKFKSLITA